jgi:hypothetical protein
VGSWVKVLFGWKKEKEFQTRLKVEMARIKGTEFRNQRDLTGELEYEFIAQAIQ